MRAPWRAKAADASRVSVTGDRPATPTVPSLGNGVSQPFDAPRIEALLESLRVTDLPSCDSEFLVDWMGVRTRISMLPWAPAELAGTTSQSLPIPDDGYRSEAGEYAALAYALATARDTFRIVEVGAGWAPWIVAGVVAARRMGLDAHGVAVEADAAKVEWAIQHAIDNGCTYRVIRGSLSETVAALQQIASEDPDCEVVIVHGAGWHESVPVHFPAIDEDDMGGAVWTLPGTDVDYRGAHLSHHEVNGVALRLILDTARGSGLIDLLHVDVQGVEFDLLQVTAGQVQEVTRLLMVGTHSRLAEGQLQHFWLERGWGLLHDDPCTGHFVMTHPTLAGFTVQDGNQLWENPFLMK